MEAGGSGAARLQTSASNWWGAERSEVGNMGQEEQAIGSDDGGSKAQSSGAEGGNSPSTGPSETHPHTKEAEKRVNPSSPGETGTTPGTNGK
jgi:hypothetical protein